MHNSCMHEVHAVHVLQCMQTSNCNINILVIKSLGWLTYIFIVDLKKNLSSEAISYYCTLKQ